MLSKKNLGVAGVFVASICALSGCGTSKPTPAITPNYGASVSSNQMTSFCNSIGPDVATLVANPLSHSDMKLGANQDAVCAYVSSNGETPQQVSVFKGASQQQLASVARDQEHMKNSSNPTVQNQTVSYWTKKSNNVVQEDAVIFNNPTDVSSSTWYMVDRLMPNIDTDGDAVDVANNALNYLLPRETASADVLSKNWGNSLEVSDLLDSNEVAKLVAPNAKATNNSIYPGQDDVAYQVSSNGNADGTVEMHRTNNTVAQQVQQLSKQFNVSQHGNVSGLTNGVFLSTGQANPSDLQNGTDAYVWSNNGLTYSVVRTKPYLDTSTNKDNAQWAANMMRQLNSALNVSVPDGNGGSD